MSAYKIIQTANGWCVGTLARDGVSHRVPSDYQREAQLTRSEAEAELRRLEALAELECDENGDLILGEVQS